jgi:hypothetical protein
VESYGLCDVARLTGVSVSTLRREVRAGDRDAFRAGRTWRFTWRQLAFVAFNVWSLAEIHEALGADACAVLPPLLALRTVTVRLPEYIIRALETDAADRHISLDHYLYGELVDFAGTACDRLAQRIPGYRRAYFYPGEG